MAKIEHIHPLDRHVLVIPGNVGPHSFRTLLKDRGTQPRGAHGAASRVLRSQQGGQPLGKVHEVPVGNHVDQLAQSLDVPIRESAVVSLRDGLGVDHTERVRRVEIHNLRNGGIPEIGGITHEDLQNRLLDGETRRCQSLLERENDHATQLLRQANSVCQIAQLRRVQKHVMDCFRDLIVIVLHDPHFRKQPPNRHHVVLRRAERDETHRVAHVGSDGGKGGVGGKERLEVKRRLGPKRLVRHESVEPLNGFPNLPTISGNEGFRLRRQGAERSVRNQVQKQHSVVRLRIRLEGTEKGTHGLPCEFDATLLVMMRDQLMLLNNEAFQLIGWDRLAATIPSVEGVSHSQVAVYERFDAPEIVLISVFCRAWQRSSYPLADPLEKVADVIWKRVPVGFPHLLIREVDAGENVIPLVSRCQNQITEALVVRRVHEDCLDHEHFTLTMTPVIMCSV